MSYPALAVENGVEGMIIVSFIIEMDGSIAYSRVVRDIGAGLGDEALRIVRSMPDWSPGKQRGRPVRVQYNLPVKFLLEGKSKKAKEKKD